MQDAQQGSLLERLDEAPSISEGADSTEPIVARPYQEACVKAIYEWWHSRKGEYPVCVLPTASGKTIIFSLLIRSVLGRWPDVRVMILAHRKELLGQAEKKLKRVWPGADTGIYCAGLSRREAHAQITIASRDSIASQINDLLSEHGAFDLVIVDEAHRMSADEVTRYAKIQGALLEANSQMTLIGFTATDYRTDSGYIHGPGQPFAGVAYRQTIPDMIDDGYLAPPIAKRVDGEIDTTGVRTTAGDFNLKQLSGRAEDQDLIDLQIDEWVRIAWEGGRRSNVFFCVSIKHAEMVTERLGVLGYDVGLVHGKTPAQERAYVLEEFDSGRLPCVVNVGVLTEGWDCPRLDCIVMMRPTKALGLFIQMVGRGLRPSPETGKEDCLLLDFGGCLERFGPIDRAKPPKKRKRKKDGDDDALIKDCPNCGTILPRFAPTCTTCNHDFRQKTKVCPNPACGEHNSPKAIVCERCGTLMPPEDMEAKASSAVVLSGAPQRNVQMFDVIGVDCYAATSGKTGARYLRLTYDCGLLCQFTQNVMVGYEGYVGKKAWQTLSNVVRPEIVSTREFRAIAHDADLIDELQRTIEGGIFRDVARVYVDINSKWQDVLYVEYAG